MASITCNPIFVLGCKYNINESNDNGKFEKKWRSEFTRNSRNYQKNHACKVLQAWFLYVKKLNIFFCFWDSSVLFTDYSPKTALWLSVSAFSVSYSLNSSALTDSTQRIEEWQLFNLTQITQMTQIFGLRKIAKVSLCSSTKQSSMIVISKN